MKKTNIFRVLIYLSIAIVFVAYIQIGKKQVIESRQQTAITLIGEKLQNGIPVDITEVHPKQLIKTIRVTVTEINKKNKTLTFYFDSTQRKQLKKNQKVIDTDKQQAIGKVTFLARNLSSGLGLYKGKIQLDKDQDLSQLKLKSLDVIVGKSSNVLALPQSAILFSEDGGSFIWVDDKGVSKKKEIELGKNYNLDYEITKGLSEGMRVVINGGKTLNSESKLRVRKCESCEGVVKND